jgi:hypothetical protein
VSATPTRTLNPLPFNDLEPHRFEDLVQQLAYELRRWRSLEATGRLGSDEDLDVLDRRRCARADMNARPCDVAFACEPPR